MQSRFPFANADKRKKNAVYGRIVHSPSVKGNQRKSVVVLELYEEPVRLQLTWFNMPFSAEHAEEKGSVFLSSAERYRKKIRPSRDGAAGNLHSCRIP